MLVLSSIGPSQHHNLLLIVLDSRKSVFILGIVYIYFIMCESSNISNALT